MAPSNNTGPRSALFWFGLGFAAVGIKTLFTPIYYFRGAYVDFTGHNIEVGCSLLFIGISFFGFSFYRSKDKIEN